jgi:D-Tyr-tRNAtyr deacylase
VCHEHTTVERYIDHTLAILQRVASASVTVDNHLVSSIGKGTLVFAAIAPTDTAKEVESMAAKVVKMKMWPDDSDANVCLPCPPEPFLVEVCH